MDVRATITGWTGTGATRNARASLDEWNRAQEAVAALIRRLDHHRDIGPAGEAPPATLRSAQAGGAT